PPCTIPPRSTSPPTQAPLFATLSPATRHCQIIHARGDTDIGFAERSRASGTGIRHIKSWNASLANLLQDALGIHGIGLKEVATDEHLDVFDRHTCIFERQHGSVSTKLGNVLVWIPAEFDHPYAEYIHISHKSPPLWSAESALILAWLEEESNDLDGFFNPLRVLFLTFAHLARDHFDRHAKFDLGWVGLDINKITTNTDPFGKVDDRRDIG